MMTAPKRYILLGLATALPFFAGCSMFNKEEQVPPTVQTEQAFRERWIQQRGAQLVSEGATPSEAKHRATQEFRERYDFTNISKQ